MKYEKTIYWLDGKSVNHDNVHEEDYDDMIRETFGEEWTYIILSQLSWAVWSAIMEIR